ncbi:hypothetical protein [Oxalicibacterium sp.]|uniref:hypothetical protein n=1 Tax=Oxalicibacterium sp. TaxID=2766525 RepID=UPI0039C9071A
MTMRKGAMDTNASETSGKRASMWRWPIVLGIASGVGLVSALIGDDGYDALSWCLLALPLIVIARSLCAKS